MPVLLFDVLDTLVVDPFHDALPAHFGLTLEEYLGAKTPEAWPAFETARLSEEAFLDQMFADRRRVDGVALRTMLSRAYRWMDGMEPLLQRLRDRSVPLHIMSNYPNWYHLIEEELGLSRYLDWTFVSWDTGVRKPDPRAYTRAAARLQRPPDDLWLIDDQAGNVDAARAAGWHGHHFVGSAAGLAEALEGAGIL